MKVDKSRTKVKPKKSAETNSMLIPKSDILKLITYVRTAQSLLLNNDLPRINEISSYLTIIDGILERSIELK